MIQARDLTFSYPGTSRPAVLGMNFEIEPGELFGVLGPSGAGKSTTQKILIGLLKNYSGTVSVLGKSLSDWRSDYYERVGVSFEFPNHFLKLTGLENLTYFGRLYRGSTEAPADLLAWLGLEEDGHTLVSQYSKGMKNRLSVARALLNRPDLLFLDEPTAGLDPLNARRVKELILEQKQAGRTIFLTTHDMTVADQLCDRVAFVVDSQIVLVGRPRDLKLRYGLRQVRVEWLEGEETRSREFGMEGLGSDAEFVALLDGGRVQTIHSLEATLESVFIQVTGRSLL